MTAINHIAAVRTLAALASAPAAGELPGVASSAALEQAADKQDVQGQFQALEQELQRLSGLLQQAVGDKAPPVLSGAMQPGAGGGEDLLLALQVLMQNVDNIRIDSAKTGLKVNQTQRQQTHNESIAKLELQIAEVEKQRASEKANFILGLVLQIVTIVVSVALLVATAGTAAPLVIALAALALAYSVANLAMTAVSAIAAANGQQFPSSLDELVAKGIGQLMEEMGVEKDKAKEIGHWFAFALSIGITLAPGVVALGPAAARGLVKVAAKVAEKSGHMVQQAVKTTARSLHSANNVGQLARVADITAKAGTGVAAGTQIAVGGSGLAGAAHERQAGMLKAERMELDAFLTRLDFMFSQLEEQLREVIESMEERIGVIGRILAANTDTGQRISRNLAASGRAAV